MKKFILFYRENTQKLICSLEYAVGVLRGLGLNSSLQGINFNRKGIYYVAFLLLLFSQSSLHSQIIIDGDPSDWPAVLNNPANTKKAFKHDPFDVLHVDDQWTGGSSDTGANPSTHWFWANGNSNDKGDIANAGAVLLGTKLYFFGDRTAANGNAQIGFWFFKDDVRPTGNGSGSSPFTGEHVNGDILIISNFVNGGGNAQPSIYIWAGKTDVNPGALILVTGVGLDAALTTNSSVVNVPTGQMFNGEMWTFYPKFGETETYPNPLFFEGYLDLATLPGEYNACFQRFLLETRNSQSISASLQDLVAGQFYGIPPAPTAISNAFCGTGSVSLSASGCNGTLKWYTSAIGGVAIGEGSPFNTPEISETTTYYVSCTVDGCEGPRTAVTATINPPPSGVGVPTHVTCYGAATGSIDLTPSGGTPPYTYAWTKVGDANFAASTQDLSDLTAGVYNVIITDSKGCEVSDQVEITEPPLVTPEISKNPGNASTLCGVSPSEAQALINTAFTNWLNESGEGYENGVHVDNPGTAPYTITMSPENPSAPLYSGGSIDVTWTITDACGVSDTVIGTFTVDNNCRIICETVPTDVLCHDSSTGSIAVTASAGFPPYNFYLYLSSDLNTQLDSVLDVDSNPGMATFLNLPAGTYTILITDAVQDLEDPTLCADTSILQPEAPLSNQITSVNILCYGAATGSIDLTPSGGTSPYTFSWSASNGGIIPEGQEGNEDLTELVAGTYSVVITDSNECQDNAEIEITEPPLATPEISKNPGNASTLCGVSPSEAQALIDTAFTNWLNETGEGYENGVHVDNPGTAPYTITISPENPSAPLYSGGSIDVTWTITDACGLTDTVVGTFTVDNNCRIICETVPTDVLCNDDSTGSIAVTASAGFPPYNFYLYLSSDLNTQLDSVLNIDSNPGMATFLNLPAGTYTILITDAVQDLEDPTLCADVSISQPEAPLSSQISNIDVLCYGEATGSIDLSPSGGTPPYTFSWSASNGGVIPEGQENNEDLTGLVAGTYSVVIVDANGNEGGCRNENSAEIMQSEELTCSIEKNSDEICIGGLNGSATVTILDGSGDYTYLWDNGETTATATGLSGGLHSVTITDSNGCVTSCEITIATIPCDDAHCTYTQGFYGNYGGLGCTPDYGIVNSHVMMTNALTQVGGSFNFGSLNTGNYFLLKLSDVTGAGNPAQNKIYKMLPGGGSPRALVGYATYDEYATWSDNDPLVAKGANKGKINNNLLSQTITLFFNLQMDQSLGGVVLESSFATAKTITCGSNEPNMETAQEFTISSSLISYLENNGGATVDNLFALANKSLGGESTGGINAATINYAVDAINRGFDECRVKVVIPEETIETRSIAFDDKDAISNSRPISGNVTIYPVPFQDSFTVNYGLDYDSLIKVQIFDIKGSLIYQLNDIDTKQNHEIRVEPTFNKGKGEMYIVKVITDREVIIKKVISSQF